MHFEILVEDLSGKRMLEILLPKILQYIKEENHTFRVFHYKGLGHIPNDLHKTADPEKRLLLNRLPQILQGYGHTYPPIFAVPVTVIVVMDLDERCLRKFRQELHQLWENCRPRPNAVFCFAIEEMEAWLLGDVAAVQMAYPNAKEAVLSSYINDSICGTWETLADAIHNGGSARLTNRSWSEIGQIKSEWAQKIAPYMDIGRNQSSSFRYFLDKIFRNIRQFSG